MISRGPSTTFRRSRLALLAGAALAVALVCAPAAAASNTMVVQPDGKIVLAGSGFPAAGALVRYLPDGSLDPSFGKGGIATDRRLGAYTALGLQADGSILAAARREDSSPPEPSIGRYLADGSPDRGFGEGGLAADPVLDYMRAEPTAIVAEPGGELVVASNYCCGAKPGYGSGTSLLRYSAGGTYQGTEALLATDSSAPGYYLHCCSYEVNDLLPRSDGSLVGVGARPVATPTGAGQAFLLARFEAGTPNGYDPSFGGGEGLVGGPGFVGDAIAEDAGGYLVAGVSSSYHAMLARYDGEGLIDAGFGEGGHVDLSSVGSFSSRLGAVAVAPGGTIFAVGTAATETEPGSGKSCERCRQAFVAMLTPSGSLDPSFGEGGIVRLAGGSLPPMSGDDLHLLGDGSILVSGTATAESHAFVLARLTPGGSLDPTFGDGGVATTFTCPGDPRQPVQRNCFAKPRVNLRVRGLLGPKPSLRLKVKSDVSWASITGVRLVLPRALRMRLGWGEYKFRMRGERVRPRLSRHMVRFTGLATPWLSFSLWRGAFGAAHRLPSHRKLAFRVRVTFHVEGEAPQTVVIRRRP